MVGPVLGVEIRIHCEAAEAKVTQSEPAPHFPVLESLDSVRHSLEVGFYGTNFLIIFFNIRQRSVEILLRPCLETEVGTGTLCGGNDTKYLPALPVLSFVYRYREQKERSKVFLRTVVCLVPF